MSNNPDSQFPCIVTDPDRPNRCRGIRRRSAGLWAASFCIVAAMPVPADDSAAAAAAKSAPPKVKLAPVEAVTETTEVALPARTAPAEEVRIYSRATGLVSKRPVDIGDAVAEGDLLAEIDAPEIGFQVEAAAAEVREAEARLALAGNELGRARGLAPTRAIAVEDIDLRESNLREAEARLAAAKAEKQRLEAIQAFQTIRAPFPGIIAGRQVERGDHVRGDQTQPEQWLYHLVRLDALRIEVDATPELALRVKPGQKAVLTFPDLPGRVFEAEVARRSGVIDTQSGTMRLELVLPNPGLELPSGLAGNARFTLPPREGTTRIPSNALFNRDGRPHVLTVIDGRARFVAVLPGKNSGPRTEIHSGLDAGQKVAINPNSLIREGDPVAAAE